MHCCREGLRDGTLVSGPVRINKGDFREAYCPVDAHDKDILIPTFSVW
jgi:hypothetical protein